ncbi:MAG TPA: hypothetical protein VEH10_05215 [Thermoplasmata archaeon]|nr:hypothetical protein [Thermoplasmata archaeon]
MVSCKDVTDFLAQVRARLVTTTLAAADANRLVQLQLLQLYTPDQYRQLADQVATIGSAQEGLGQEANARRQVASQLGRDYARDHSILFHLHGKEAQTADLAQEAKDRAQLQAVDADYAQKAQAFNDLLAKRAMYDNLTPYAGGYVGLTPTGAVALRDLTVRLYRYADVDFETYLAQSQRIDQELEALAAGGATYFTALSGGIPDADRAYLWAIAIGLTKSIPDPSTGVPRFVQAYRATGDLAGNSENRLMASEILVAVPKALTDEVPALTELVHEVRGVGVPKESALGVASIVLFGQRADGSFATANLQRFLQVTRSYESAALLGIVNAPADALAAKFQALRSMFASWGYTYSEDTELSSAYLAVSENAPEQVGSKLAILARGLAAYLQYPLVAAAILGSIPTLEANEALNLVEKAYGVVGRRAAGLTQTELICLAVRMVHGIRNELVGTLDATAPVAATAAAVGAGPRMFFLPIVIAHYGYYSTYGGVGGVHPGHVHGLPTGFGGAGVG